MGSELGANMTLAFNYVQQIYRETAQLMRKLDSLMGKEWSPTFGNRTTRGVTSHLDNPDFWLPEGSVRIYDDTKRPEIKRGITVAYWGEDVDEPLVIGGKIEYVLDPKTRKPMSQDYWDLWEAWFPGNFKTLERRYDGTVYETEYEVGENKVLDKKGSRVFALPLASIQSEKDIETKVYDRLMSL